MKKVYKLEDLGCANCAAKMEEKIAAMDGVEDVRVNFMMQKLTLKAEDSLFPGIVDECQKIISSVEPDCVIKR